MTTENLIKKGYFPDEITPHFSSEGLGIHVPALIPLIDRYDPVDFLDTSVTPNVYRQVGNKKRSKFSDFSIPKIGQFRRRTGLPNPLHQLRLSYTIANKWGEITNHTERSNFSLFRLKVDNSLEGRSIENPTFEDIAREKIIRSVGSKYLLQLDIAKFYQSIYTHSIPWALHTKRVAKGHRQRQLFGNAVDQDSQKIQDGQTMGIPIGPDTSRIISEIIATSIDIEIQSKMPELKAIRIIDDYYVYLNTLAEIEKFNSIIQQQLRLYELDLNISKQKVIEMPDTITNPWAYELSNFWFGEGHKNQRKDLIQFFDTAFRFSIEYPEDYVLRYATSRIRKIVMHKSNLDLFISFLLKCMSVESKTIPYATENIIAYFIIDPNMLNISQLEKTINNNLLYHIGLENHFEVAWLTWLLKRLKIKMSKPCSDNIGKIDNPVVALDALSMVANGLVPNPIDTSLWQTYLTLENLYSENWLIAYEAVNKGWLTPSTNYLPSDPFFNHIQSLGVSFYDELKDISFNQVKALDNRYLVIS